MKFSSIEHNPAEQLRTAIGVYDVPWVRYNQWRLAPNIRNGRSKPSGPPRSFDSTRQRQRYLRQGLGNAILGQISAAPAPSGDGATEFFGVRQQRRAFMRRQNKNLRSELKREKRKQKRAAS